ncbi:MAG: Ig-like domain-containing protein [Gemmatimonadales bacterium]
MEAGSGNNQHGAPGRELSAPIEVKVTDKAGRAVPGVTVRFSVATGGGRLSSDSAQSDTLGVAGVRWVLGEQLGAQNLSAEAVNNDNAPLEHSPLQLSATAEPAVAAKLVLHAGLPETAQNGVPLEGQPALDVLDADDQPIAGVEVTASVSSGGGTVTGSATATSDGDGVASFSNLALTGAQGAQILRFTAQGAATESGPIQLLAGTPATMDGVEPLTYEGTVNSPVSPGPSVMVKDAAGNGVPGIEVTFTPNRNSSVSPEVATTNEQGLAQVSWTLGTTANVQYTLTARIEASPVPSVRFTATARAGAAGRLRISTQPSSITQSGTPFAQQPVLQTVDENGNPTAQPGIMVTAAVSSGPSGTLTNQTAITDANGQAAFSGLAVTGVAGNYTLSFSAPGLGGITSTPFAITEGSAARLAFVTQPSTAARSRQPLVSQPVLQIQDASGNPIAQAGVMVTVSALPSGTTVTGETVATDGNGRAAFSGLTLQGIPGPKDLTFAAPGLQSATARVTLPSVSTVTAAQSHPASAVVGSTVAGPVMTWTFRDASTRPVADADFTLKTPSGGTALPVTPFSDLNGVVQAGSWTLGTTAGYQYLQLGLPDGRVFRDSILATPGPATQLVKVSGDDPMQSAPINSELPDLFVVRVVDQFGNGVANVNVQWSTCDGTAGEPVPPTDANGYSSTRQPTGTEPSGDQPFCTMATAAVPEGSPVQFQYTVTASAAAMSQLRTASSARHSGPPPIAPESRGGRTR